MKHLPGIADSCPFSLGSTLWVRGGAGQAGQGGGTAMAHLQIARGPRHGTLSPRSRFSAPSGVPAGEPSFQLLVVGGIEGQIL